jgi:hypothetical protein
LRVPRLVLERKLGRALEPGEQARHLCPGGGNPACCNKRHLAPGSRADKDRRINKHFIYLG